MPKINLETDNLSFSQKLWKNLAKDILNPWIPKSPTLLKRKFVNFKLDFNTVSFIDKKKKKIKFISKKILPKKKKNLSFLDIDEDELNLSIEKHKNIRRKSCEGIIYGFITTKEKNNNLETLIRMQKKRETDKETKDKINSMIKITKPTDSEQSISIKRTTTKCNMTLAPNTSPNKSTMNGSFLSSKFNLCILYLLFLIIIMIIFSKFNIN